MIAKYFKIDELSTVLKVEIEPKRTVVYKWVDNKWKPTGSDYAGIFTGEIEIEEIEEGSPEWDDLKLRG